MSRRRVWTLLGCASLLATAALAAGVAQGAPPVLNPAETGHRPITERRTVRPFANFSNLLLVGDLQAGVALAGRSELAVDLSHIRALTDGTPVDPARLYGKIYAGPYPFEAAESRAIYRFPGHPSAILGAKGAIPAGDFFQPRYNSEAWTDGGHISVRFELFLQADAGPDRWLGVYDTTIRVKRGPGGALTRVPALVEGPLLSLDDARPGALVVHLKLDRPARVSLKLSDGRTLDSPAGAEHAVRMEGLRPGQGYAYTVQIDGAAAFPTQRFRAPPAAGAEAVRFVFFADTRAGFDEGAGVGDRAVMGVNKDVAERLSILGDRLEPDFAIVGGDIGFGYTTAPADLDQQFHAFKQAAVSLWSRRPVFVVMGNHDSAIDLYEDAHRHGVRLDRQPYGEASSEAVFARAFPNPVNGPTPSDPRRPSYARNAYAFQQGPLKFIVMNTNYWMSNQPDRFGGSPEGYLLRDQLDWIKREIAQADRDPTVERVILIGHEPVFPNGGHVADAMWWNGDNQVRAYEVEDAGRLAPSRQGVLEVRDELLRAVTASPKVALMLSADEHSYHKTLITPQTPIASEGDAASPIARPLWFVSSAGGGASYYAEEATPWNQHWRQAGKYGLGANNALYYSSQPHLLMFEYAQGKLSMRVLSLHGEEIDRIDNLIVEPR